jgi:Amt family ammonium transporter
VAVGLYSFILAWIIGKIIDKTMGFRATEEDEVTGIDITTHAETGYDLGSVHSSGVAAVNGPVQSVTKKVDA